jgi:1,4-alpha-glucan branching enzyme
MVSEGRRREFARHTGFDGAAQREIPDPQDEATFLASKLRPEEQHEGTGQEMRRMYAELLALRRHDDVLRAQDRERMRAMASGDLLLVHLWHGREQRLIAANFGVAIDAPPGAAGVPPELAGLPWRMLFSSDARQFGGNDEQARLDRDFVSLAPHTVVLLAARRRSLPGRAREALRRLAARRRR